MKKRAWRGIFAIDMRRAFFSWRFAAAWALSFAVLCVMRNAWNFADVVNEIDSIFSGTSSYSLILIILPSIPYSYCYIAEHNSNSSKYWISRCGVREYASSKFISAVLSGMFVFILSMVFIVFISLHYKPLWIELTPEELAESYSDYEKMMMQYRAPVLRLVLTILHMALSAALSAGIAFCISAIVPNLFIAIMLPTLLDFAYLRLHNLLPIPLWMDEHALYQSIYSMGSASATFFTKFGIVAAILLVAWLISYFAIRRRAMHE